MSQQFKKILVCTDFSQQSKHALLAAEKIRAVTGGQISLLHVCYGFPGEQDLFPAREDLDEEVFSFVGDLARKKNGFSN